MLILQKVMQHWSNYFKALKTSVAKKLITKSVIILLCKADMKIQEHFL